MSSPSDAAREVNAALGIHKAAPAAIPPPLSAVIEWVCVECGRDIKKVPGGQGPTWVHTATGTVVGASA